MRWLAIDYGDARTGLAVCDESETLATPLTPQIEEKSLNRCAQRVAHSAAAQGAGGLLCGLPRNMDGSEGARAKTTRRFAQRLAEAAGMPVVLWDERRTTVSATALLGENEVFGQKRKARLDAVSAAVLLESFLHWRRLHPGAEPPDRILPAGTETR